MGSAGDVLPKISYPYIWGGGNIGISEMMNRRNFPNVHKYTRYVNNIIKQPSITQNELSTKWQLIEVTHSLKTGVKNIIQ